MPSPPPASGVTDAAIFANYLSEFFMFHGLQQCDVVRTAKKLNPSPGKIHWLDETDLTASTLSRILTGIASGKPRKRAPRWKTFNTIVLAGLHITWATKGQIGPAPGLPEVEQVWNGCQEFRQKTLAREGLVLPPREVIDETSAGAVAESMGEAKSGADLLGTEQRRYENAYGEIGVSLLAKARAGERDTALLLGVIRTVDGHLREGETWLRAARSLGHPRAADLMRTTGPEDLRRAAVRSALEIAVSLGGAPETQTRKVLLLERAALGGSREAALFLALHYDEIGEAGHAARWREAAA
jgi:hypothetical protein